jgi:hypothetical protein
MSLPAPKAAVSFSYCLRAGAAGRLGSGRRGRGDLNRAAETRDDESGAPASAAAPRPERRTNLPQSVENKRSRRKMAAGSAAPPVSPARPIFGA